MFSRLLRKIRNAALDFRFGAFVGGKIEESEFSAEGANAPGNSDYEVLAQVFDCRISPDDVLVDVGCGRGRVLNYWLSLGLRNRIYGLEIDHDIALKAARRLRRWPNVSILCGDATRLVPQDASVLYLFNPFQEPVIKRFEEAVRHLPRLRLIVYYSPVHAEVFQSISNWSVEFVPVKRPAGAHFMDRHYQFALITPNR
jgi:precorrin-6B methylase 2